METIVWILLTSNVVLMVAVALEVLEDGIDMLKGGPYVL